MTKQKYQEPKISLEITSDEDVITASAPMGVNGEGKWENEDIVDREGFFS